MALPVVESVSTTAWASATSVTTDKPSGLAVGDLMVGVVAYTSGRTLTYPTGWQSFNDGTVTDGTFLSRNINLSFKVADSSDVAASNFTWSISGGAENCAGGILRISGYDTTVNYASTDVTGYDDIQDTITPTYVASITPSRNYSLIIFAVSCGNASTNISNVENYACATSNPTWTERIELLSGVHSLAVATAVRTETSATGNFSCQFTGGSATTDSIGIVAYILRSTAFTATATDTVTPSDSLTVNIGYKVSATDTTTVTDSVSPTTNNIRNTSKSSSSWSNVDKS